MSENQEQQECQKPISAFLWRYGFLVVILCLLGEGTVRLVNNLRSGYSGEKYGNMVVLLMLLFNHLAYFWATSGLWSKIMKRIAWAWLIIGCIYIFSR